VDPGLKKAPRSASSHSPRGSGPLKGGKRERKQMTVLKRLLRDESGATAIEYALIAAGISIVIVTAAKSIGTNLSGTFTSVQNALQ
jgi:pilus assembly protein Flp/PilA